MYWFWALLFLIITYSNYSTEAKEVKSLTKDVKNLPAAVIVGAVYCDTCAQKNVLKSDHFIAGASVAVQCRNTSTTKPGFRHEVKTNRHGEFEVHLPYQTSKYLRKIRGCTVELISSNEPYCAIAARSTSSSLRLNSREGRKYVFTAGILTFKPLIQPQICEPTIKTLTYDEKLPEFSNPTDQTILPPLENSTPNQSPDLVHNPTGQASLPPVENSTPNTSPDLIRSPTGQAFLQPVENSPSSHRPDLDLHLPLLPELPKLPPLPELPHLPPLPGISFFPPLLPKIPGIPFQPLVPKIPGIPFVPPQHLPLPPSFPFRPITTPVSNTDNGAYPSQSETKSP